MYSATVAFMGLSQLKFVEAYLVIFLKLIERVDLLLKRKDIL